MNSDQIVGVLLAGGLSRRMGGGDKSLSVIGNETLLSRVIARTKGQVGTLVLNANGDAARFDFTGLNVVADDIADYPGPLAGVLSAMAWAKANQPAATHIASFATDAPFLPRDMVARLGAAIDGGADIACAMSDGRTHPPFALWPVALEPSLRTALVDEGMRKIDAWTARYNTAHVEFDTDPVDPFFNVNRPENLEEAAHLLAEDAGEITA